MERYKRTFKKRHTFLPVIHVKNEAQAILNTRTAQEHGADGVFLIDHQNGAMNSAMNLFRIYEAVHAAFPGFWIGLNLLNQEPYNALELIEDKNLEVGLWTDNAGVDENGQSVDAEIFLDHHWESPWKGIYFGGVAFKYQTPVKDFSRIARRSVPFMDVITTSGMATGSAPELEKIRAMRRGAGEHPIAIASGISAENVRLFMPHVDCFLVATSISASFNQLDPKKVAELAKILNP